jgi:N-methylhydantoinase A
MVAEVLTWRVKVSTLVAPPEPVAEPAPRTLVANRHERVLDPDDGWLDFAVFRRADLKPGDCFAGPALVVEDQTTTVVSPRFDARIDGRDHLVLTAERVTGRNS